MAENTQQKQQNTQQQHNTQRISRAEFIQRTMERKKRAIENNRNAQVFVSDSIAGFEIFNALRTLDAMDAAIRRLWGISLDSKDVKKWIKDLTEVKTKITALEEYGRGILVKSGNANRINDGFLRRSIAREINKQEEEKKVASKPEKAEKAEVAKK